MTTTPYMMIVTQHQKNLILVTGCAILAAYFLNFVVLSILDLLGKANVVSRIRLHVSPIMYVFGVAGMLSICAFPFFLLHTFHAVMAWITFLAIVILHVAYMRNSADSAGKLRAVVNGVYWLCCNVWWWGIMVIFLKDNAWA